MTEAVPDFATAESPAGGAEKAEADTQTVGVAVIIVNWRAPKMTEAAVHRALDQTLQPACVYVVDNGSGDVSIELLETTLSHYGGRVRLLANPDNRGFGGGCNTALRTVIENDYDFVWLLNNDAEPAQDCLDALVTRAQTADQPVGIVGSLLHDPEGQGVAHFGNWMHPASLICENVTGEADLADHRYAWATAASMLVSVPALRTTGIFDERFFMYWEDADLNMRIREAGYSVVLTESARVTHSAGTSSRSIPVDRYLWHFESQSLWLSKHHSHPRLARLWLRGKFLLKALIDGSASRFGALARYRLQNQPRDLNGS